MAESTSSRATYQIPIGAVLSFWTGFVLSTLLIAALAAYALLLGARVQAGLLVLAWALIFFGVALPSLLATRRVDVHANRLVAVTTLGLRRSVEWQEIARTRERPADRIWRGYAVLDLLDRDGRVCLRINSRLAGYDRLLEEIRRHVEPSRTGG